MTLVTPSLQQSAVADRPLHDGWSVVATAGPVPEWMQGGSVAATVPGSIHTDLLAAGLIPDPYLDDNERLVAWIGLCDWRYGTTFDWADDGRDRHDLVFEGLDTVAVVELNGERVAATMNMHRTYRFEVSSLLREGSNELTVSFASPVKAIDRAALEQGYRPHVNHHPYNSLRKMACNFGWDWGPDLATVGIWRPVSLQSWSTARLASVRPTVTVDGVVDGSVGTVHLDVDLERASDVAAVVRVQVAGVSVETVVEPGDDTVAIDVTVPEVDLWWPRSHGGQPLYPIEVSLVVDQADDATVVDSWQSRIGFRSVRIDLEPDEHGTPFTFIVNGQPIFIRGANWIPDDAFPHRVDRARYARRIAQAELANINLLRVWGGGIYESDDFFDVCDERGILTWQDFLFACAAYSEEEPMRSEVEAEVRDNIARLQPHPSLVLWNGSNENIWGYFEWGWEPRLSGKTWGLGYYHELLPSLVGELDPSRPYTPSSPFSPATAEGEADHYPNDASHGSMHIWELWNREDYPHYRDHTPRFVGEFGWQGPPTWATQARSISDDPLTPVSPGVLVHQKAQDGNVKLIDGLVAHIALPDDMQDWHWAMSLNQAVAVQVGIEHFRSLSPICMGSIVWQLNDCWPVTSWAAVDGDGRAKPLLFAIKHAYADRLVTVQPRDGGLAVVAVNDSDEAWTGDMIVRRLRFDGSEIASAVVAVDAPARTTATVTVDAFVTTPEDAASEVLEGILGDERGLWFFAEYKDSALADPELGVSVTPTISGYDVTVVAGNLVRDLTLLVDRLDPGATVDDQLVTLMPGESVTFAVTSSATLPDGAFADPDVLRSANQLMTVRSAR